MYCFFVLLFRAHVFGFYMFVLTVFNLLGFYIFRTAPRAVRYMCAFGAHISRYLSLCLYWQPEGPQKNKMRARGNFGVTSGRLRGDFGAFSGRKKTRSRSEKCALGKTFWRSRGVLGAFSGRYRGEKIARAGRSRGETAPPSVLCKYE